MPVDLSGVRAVLLPGTGSDADYVRRAFGPALGAAGATLITPATVPSRLVDGYRRALDEAAGAGPIAVGGVSLGAAVGVAWALQHPEHTVAVLAALPAWSGDPRDAPAAAMARLSAHQLRSDGLAAATARMQQASPAWLAEELARSWAGQWPDLPEAMEQAARYVAPTASEMAALRPPMGVASATDDPVHPLDVGIEWVAAAPKAALRTVTLAQFGADPGALGAACVAALDDLAD